MGPILDAQLRVWDAKNFGLVSPGTHRNKFVKKSLQTVCKSYQQPALVGNELKGLKREVELTHCLLSVIC